jgi:hypothetical protein
MKNLLLILSAVFSFSLGYGGAPETVEMLSSKVILESKEGYYVLSNGACLKVVGFSTRWRTPSEWWNNVELVPKNYECVPDDWFLGSEIEVYAKYENLEVNLENATNAEILTQCTHLLYNTRTGQVLFAIWMHPAECLVQIFNDAHKDGYDKGYKEGYDKGYKGGYKIGYEDGYQAAL